ncbi:glycerol uptake protein [Trypanosoma conorhini]|uniref:Glycerol uptake protein n=1 Tax=Trypanosoma conorhini TaxID=83891 RepID=A0A3R7LEF8_9TRYP|nr:glycerol uptake protein [Trypanosoma conorhini]RNF26785.1 glycerol uptake protein [Trypanosoma conorhini]
MCVLTMFVLELSVGFIWSSPRCARLRCSRYQRLIRSFGGLFTVFGLIVANLIGFSSGANAVNGRPMDRVTTEDLWSVGPVFVLTLFLFLYCAAALCAGRSMGVPATVGAPTTAVFVSGWRGPVIIKHFLNSFACFLRVSGS